MQTSLHMTVSINVCVTEVKEVEGAAIESQHNEQMLGLWRHNQQVMLGLEVSGMFVRPKILLLKEGQLNMFYLKKLDIRFSCDLASLISLMTSFLIYVDYLKTLTLLLWWLLLLLLLLWKLLWLQ